MISGMVRDFEIIVSLPLLFADGSIVLQEFVLDTGFAGALLLPESEVIRLQLPFYEFVDSTLANGKMVRLPQYIAEVNWHGKLLPALVIATGNRPLLGMALLAGSELWTRIVEGGGVEIKPTSAP